MSKRAMVYARVSVATEESVSVARQLEAGLQYASARNWTVVGEFVDDGVSATQLRPEQRAGWAALLTSPEWFDAVIIWKVDRLARRVLDFLRTDEALQARGAAIVCVEQSIDMTTGEGRAFAQMLAVFGELEAAATSARVRAARDHLIRSGRTSGGPPLYGWQSVPNPDGPGRILVHDPERIDWVRGMVERVLAGQSVYSIKRWLEDAPAPRPRATAKAEARRSGRWNYSTVQRLLTHPLLAGMTLHNPGAGAHSKAREVLRASDGTPIIRPDLAIISPEQHDTLLRLIATKPHPAARPRDARAVTSPLLSQLAHCGACDRDRPMHRAIHSGRATLKCPNCFQVISARLLAMHLEQRLLAERGTLPMFRPAVFAVADPILAARLEQVEQDLREAALALIDDTQDLRHGGHRIAQLKETRDALRARAGLVSRGAVKVEGELVELGMDVAEIWARCANDEQRRHVLLGQIKDLTIYRAPSSRAFNPARVHLTWRSVDIRPVPPAGVVLEGPIPADTRLQPAWISTATAVQLTGHTETIIRDAVESGNIERRHVHHSEPSLLRASVLEWAATYRARDRTTESWISFTTACLLTGHGKRAIRAAAERDEIYQRQMPAPAPSLSRDSVIQWAATYRARDRTTEPWISVITAHQLTGRSKRSLEAAAARGDIESRPSRGTRPTLSRSSVLDWAGSRSC
ncbi:hypothetical protein GCM10009795_096870 [Nocardioides hankookensis]|uniref:Recombinase family protein n=1 Tax=Nocardioides hankookensis TaxID=443157 RepID=A0ABW1LLL7_9ACTN